MVEADGLRCPYHGWLFGVPMARASTSPPSGTRPTSPRVRAAAGVAQELGGLVWAYIGPLPAPELPRFDVFVMDGVRDIGWTELPCNFVQIMENAVDPHHTEWLHGRFFEFMARHQGFDAPPSFGKKHVKVGFDAFEWGIIKRRVVEGASEEDDDWKIGHPLVFPYNMRVGGANIEQMQIRVPVDRTTTRFMLYTVHAPAGVEYPEQPQVPDYQIPVYDENGRHRVDYVEGQDMMAWVTQGPITDRTVEHLGRSDIGVTMLRRMFKEQMSGGPGRGPARGVPGLPRPDRPAVREEQVRRGRLVRDRLHRPGLLPVQPASGRAEEAAHQGERKPEGRGRVTVGRGALRA